MCSCLHNSNKTTRVCFFKKKTKQPHIKKVCISISYFFQFSDVWSFSFLELRVTFQSAKKKKNPCGKSEPLGSHKVKQCAHMHSTGTCVGSRCRWREEPAVSVHGEQNGMAKKNSSRKGGTKTAGVILFYFGTSHKQALRERATDSMSHSPAGPHSLTAKTSSAGSDNVQQFSLLPNRFGQDL